MYLPYAKTNQCVQVVYSIFGIIFNRFELKWIVSEKRGLLL